MDIAMGGLGAIGTRVARVRIGEGLSGLNHFEVSATEVIKTLSREHTYYLVTKLFHGEDEAPALKTSILQDQAHSQPV